ncbi:flavin reductase family protein [Conexibacter sp. DBS9H8]|uniref:flavin reductase family protein n=1 Tax=Conexibacter sp. DBS9H8 TaxID=2937801 RepID=UPI00200E8ACD|nr:flavin reductase family protein [Conexibacter sp. DBS9H8]
MSDTLPTEANFRRVLGRLPTGVVVVTGGDPDAPSGLVVGSFMSVSLDPPLVAVCPAKTSTSWPRLEAAGCFCANVLGEEQGALVPVFSRSGPDKFGGLDWGPAPATGAPLLAGAAAWIDCAIHETIEAGDHWLVLATVLALGLHGSGGALVFHGGALKSLS